ncbi:ABC transporter permease subunit [Streptomyces sp. NPDC059247]|uniref:ABC transporter permease subunit n=1 Tax=Streptomyces sp. NPDC059247 TaxID=3346790 RepID=UPI00369DCCA6
MSALALRGPYWVTVRQHRRSLWCALALTALGVALLITSRLWSDAAVEALRAAGCTVDSLDRSCFQHARDYTDDQWSARKMVERAGLGMLLVPVLTGAFLAGPMIARELESGTYKLAWTQSVSPTRWLVSKLAVPLALVVTCVPLLGLVFHWSWSTGPGNDFPTYWYEPTIYASFGTVPVANALMGVALGTLVGLLVRRTVAAMALAVVATTTVLGTLYLLRPGLWPPQTLTGRELSLRVSDSWIVADGMITESGERVGWEYCRSGTGTARDCMIGRGGVADFVDHHPGSHFWPLQLVETAVLLALAALALLAAFRVLRARHP